MRRSSAWPSQPALLSLVAGGLLAACPSSAQQARSRPLDAVERRTLGVLERLDGQRLGMMNVPRQDGRLLRLLVEAIGAQHVVEVGTSNGYSGLWIALALQRTGGRLTTFEIDAGRAALARKNFARAGVATRVTVIEGDAHKLVASRVSGAVDLVFVDADKPGYLDYLRKLLPKLRPGGLFVAHNARRRGLAAFLRVLTADATLETMFLNMDGPGVVVALKKRPLPTTAPP